MTEKQLAVVAELAQADKQKLPAGDFDLRTINALVRKGFVKLLSKDTMVKLTAQGAKAMD